ncbi:MAG: hypothetical protein HY550_06045 [Elusimicrobia bacterium]|nr:hypothetical protein [Elusimicrobiota bacterium]
MTVKKQVLLGGGCAVLALFLVLLMYQGDAGGVKMSNEMEKYALDYLNEKGMLEPSEDLVAYYDATLGLDGTEAAILTTRRVIYHKDGRTEAIALAEVDDIRHRKESLIGDVIEISASSGRSMKIEIAPLNQGETFINALALAREKARPDPDAGQPPPAAP